MAPSMSSRQIMNSRTRTWMAHQEAATQSGRISVVISTNNRLIPSTPTV